jgi:hypothetical protein
MRVTLSAFCKFNQGRRFVCGFFITQGTLVLIRHLTLLELSNLITNMANLQKIYGRLHQ